MNMKPVATTFDTKNVINKNSEINNVTSPVCIPRRAPRKRLYQEDQYESFISKDSVKDFTCPHPSGCTFRKNDDHVLFYKLEENEISIPEMTGCIRIDSELLVQPFSKPVPVALPQWFRHGRDCRLSHKSILKTFLLIYSHKKNCIPLYLKNYTNIDLKKRIYSANIIRHALLLRYTSKQSYKMLLEDFPYHLCLY